MEKGSMLTAIEHGSVGPKRMVKTISESKTMFKLKYHRMTRKGIRLIFLNQDGEITSKLIVSAIAWLVSVSYTHLTLPTKRIV